MFGQPSMFLPIEGEAGGSDGWNNTKMVQHRKTSKSWC
jgi:hypothetical protein